MAGEYYGSPFSADDEIEFDMVTGQPIKKKKVVPPAGGAPAQAAAPLPPASTNTAFPNAMNAIQKRKAMMDGI